MTAPTSVVLIRNMRFYVIGVDDPAKQPRVIITVDGIAGNRENLKTTFNLQTTVSQRAKK
jgi:predicted methyltransferase MtxX (methanogen marker protein 4)